MSAPRKKGPVGSTAPLTEEEEGWVERGMKVVASCAKRHIRELGDAVTYEELLSLGSIGLMQAVRTYRADSGTDFEVYCYKRIDGAMRYGKRKERRFYALLWDAGYAHLETTRDEGPVFADEDGGGRTDEDALHDFSDRLLTAVGRRVCGQATMMQAATSEEAVAQRAEWGRRLQILVEELDQTPAEGKQVLRLVYDDEVDLKAAGVQLGLKYGAVRRLHERTLDDLGARVRRRCSFDPA